MSDSVMGCKLAKILVKKLGYLEKRVTYLEGKSRGQQEMIEKLQKGKKYKKIAKNKGKLSPELEDRVDSKPKLIEEIKSTQNIQNAPLKIIEKDPKLSQKSVVRLGVRCDAEADVERQSILNSAEKSKIMTNPIEVKKKPSKPKRQVKKFCCKFCTKFFPNFTRLSDHFRVHTGERPFKCKICLKSFSLMVNLKRHSLVHTGIKHFSCSFCSKSFALLKTRNDHIRTHTGEKPYSCSICSKTFTQSSNLSLHKKIHKVHEYE